MGEDGVGKVFVRVLIHDANYRQDNSEAASGALGSEPSFIPAQAP